MILRTVVKRDVWAGAAGTRTELLLDCGHIERRPAEVLVNRVLCFKCSASLTEQTERAKAGL